MAAWAMELSPAGFAEMLTDLDFMDRKTGQAYLRLAAYLRRFGSAPATERALSSILGVTVRFLREVAWPLLADRVVLSEDGERYLDPDIQPARQRREASAGPRSETNSANARSRWAKRHQHRDQTEMLMPIEHANPDANSLQSNANDASRIVSKHATGMQADAKNHAISMQVASVSHDFASPQDARAHPPSPSLTSLIPVDSEIQEGSTGGEGVARETDAKSMQVAVSKHATGLRTADAESPPEAIPPDWQPDAASMLEARKRGIDTDEFAAKFRDHYLHTQVKSGNWQGLFRNWCREGVRQPPNQQQPRPAGAPQAARGDWVAARIMEKAARRSTG